MHSRLQKYNTARLCAGQATADTDHNTGKFLKHDRYSRKCVGQKNVTKFKPLIALNLKYKLIIMVQRIYNRYWWFWLW